MAEELLRSKHAFGALENVLDAISSGKIDAYDILFLKDANGKPYIGWVDKNNQPVILEDEKEIIEVSNLPSIGETGKIYIYGSDGYFWNGKEFINLCKPTDVSVLESELVKLQEKFNEVSKDVELLSSEVNNKLSINVAEKSYKKVKYEVTNVPVGTLTKYFENEIRIMCPNNSAWVHQSVGNGGDKNIYYMSFKTYVPNDNVVGYIENTGDQVDDEIQTTFSTDEYGRRYQVTWLALARYNESTKEWTYFGKNSGIERYIGWDYQIDWYDANGLMIASDSIRINLSNEECHYTNEPYYISNVNAEVNTKIAELMEAMAVIEF